MQVVHVDTYNCSRTAAVAIPSFNVGPHIGIPDLALPFLPPYHQT